jgi:tape measure domain-containing protein
VSSYRADIEIGVRGARSLEQLRSSINQTARAVDSLNDVVSARGSLVQNIQNYTNNLNRAAQSLRMVGAGTQAETKAIREYVRALGEANTARARQNSLVAQEIANQRRVSAGTAPYGQQGPALPPAMVKSRQIQQNWNRFFQEAAQVGQELQTTAAAKTVNIRNSWNRFFQEAAQVGQELQTTAAAKTVNIRNSWNRFFQEAAQVGQELQTTAAAKTVNIRNSWNRFFQEATEVAVELTVQAQRTAAAIRSNEGAASAAARQRLADAAAQRQRITNAGFGVQGPALPPTAAGTTGAGFRGRIGGAVSGAVIGGAFPLLFGQSGGAAAGGAIGGLVGGLAGPGGGFAGSLLGTLIGDIASRGQAVKQLGEDLGFSVEQTKQLAAAFKTANTDVEKFTAVIQNVRGLGLELEDQAKAIQLVTTLTEKYGGSFEKTGNAITSALESGKVTQATLNQLTSQGINIQGELANKYGISRDAILQMAKDGDISVQTLIDTLVKMGNEGVAAANKPKTAMERLTASVNALGQSLAGLATNLVRAFGPAMQWLTDRVTDFVNAVSRAISRLSDLMSGGRMAQADIQAARAAETATQRKFGVLGGIRAFNPAAQKFYESQKQAELRRLVPGAFAPTAPAAGPLTSFQVPSQAAPSGGAGAKGPKPPEDRTAQLQADYKALIEIGNAENLIRDFLFEGRELLAVDVELTKTLADIERDRVKALEQANYQSERELINKTAIARESFARQVIEDKIREITQKRFEEELRAQQAIRDAVKPFTDLTKQQQLQAQYGRTYLRLVTEGVLPAEAERIANFERLVTEQLTAVEEQIKITELAILEAKARGTSTVELEKQLKIFKDQQNAVQGAAAAGPEKGKTGSERLQDAIATARGELNNLTDPINQVVAGAKAIGDAFQQAFKGLVSGAMTGQQALAAFFKGVGDHFMDMASQMIAKLIEIYILETVLGLISGAASGSFQSKSNAAGKATFGGSFKGTGSSTFGSGGIRVPGFAEGGFVTGPTRAVIGEGGEPEYVIPQSKMSAAMSRYSRGARGKSVIPGSGTSADGNTATAALEPIDVRYSVERINNVEYVTVDQFQAGMSQAAQQGAQRGEQATLRRLQQSSSTRRRIGM